MTRARPGMTLGSRLGTLLLGCGQCSLLQRGQMAVNAAKCSGQSRHYAFFRGMFPSAANTAVARKKEYSERRLLGYSMEQMYDIVVDVDKYKYFVPWCKGSSISRKQSNSFQAHITVGFPPLLEETYLSLVSHSSPHLVKSVATQGKLFNHLVTIWRFRPGLSDNPQTCILDFSVSFEFRSLLHSQIASMFFDQVVLMMVSSFLKRARVLHGPESIVSQRPKILSYDK